jgi:3-dehydroquinate synthase
VLSEKTFSTYGHITVKAEQAGETAKKLSNIVITDENVFSIYKSLFSDANSIVIKPGEQSKTLNTVHTIYQRFLDMGVSRSDTISYAGGGVVGDIAGFAAATFMRGVPLRAFPTTLLSMSDSAIGGKNGVNLNGVKNVVGTFYIPEETIINPIFLNTLPEKEILSGSGEIFKYAVLSENDIFEQLERIYAGEHGSHSSYTVKNSVKNVLFLNVLKSAVSEKLRWIEGDLTDKKGKRAFLNLGHTIGHLAEKLTNFSISHGEGVAFGIAASAFYALKNNLLSKKDFRRICALYFRMGFDFNSVSAQLKAALQDSANGNVLKILRADKKRAGDEILWILPVKYNKCTAQKTPAENIQKTLMEVINENPCD